MGWCRSQVVIQSCEAGSVADVAAVHARRRVSTRAVQAPCSCRHGILLITSLRRASLGIQDLPPSQVVMLTAMALCGGDLRRTMSIANAHPR